MKSISAPPSAAKRRFVVLHHCFLDGKREDHFDLMLEQKSNLATWAIGKIPDLGESVSARRLPDHREVYLDYEGPISGDRGSVSRVISGTYQVIHNRDSCLEVLLISNDQMVRLQIEASSSEPDGKITQLKLDKDRTPQSS